MKKTITAVVLGSYLLVPAVFSKQGSEAKPSPAPAKSPQELVAENQRLVAENAYLRKNVQALVIERDNLKKNLNELRAFMFRMNQEFKRLEKTEPKKRK